MLLYLIKSSLILAILLTFYKLFLERESIHVFKRIFLLSSILVAFGIPLITFTQYIEIPTQIVNQTIDNLATISNQTSIENKISYLPFVLWSIYGVGAFIFGLKFIYNLSIIGLKIKRNEKVKNNDFTNVLLKDLTVPHTFFNYLFFNKTKFEAKQIPKEVFLHEQAHAKQKHSIDILFIEVLRIIFWFNPLFYFLKQSIKLNHEFLADTSVIKDEISIQSYQKILLEYSSNTENIILANAFNYSLIKKRFTIMKKQTSRKTALIKTLVLLPLTTILLFGFSNKVIVPKENINLLTIPNNKNDSTFSIEDVKQELKKINALKIKHTKKDTLVYKSIKGKKHLFQTKKGITRIWNMKGNGVDENGILLPELPNISKDATPKQLKEYEIAKKQYEKKHQTKFGNGITNDEEKIEIVEVFETPISQNATLEQIKEYNNLARKYNNTSNNPIVIMEKEISRIILLYNLMSKEQQKNAEDFPNLPPPPPPIAKSESSMRVTKRFYSYKDKNGNDIKIELQYDGSKIINPPFPPPPLPQNATDKEKERYQSAIKEYKQRAQKFNKNSNANIPPPPPPPKCQLDHIIDMAKKNADFHYKNKKISSDKAIQIIKNNTEMNILTKRIDSGKPQVFISTEPIQ